MMNELHPHNQTPRAPVDADVGGAGDAHEERGGRECNDVALHAVPPTSDWSGGTLFFVFPSFLPSYSEMNLDARAWRWSPIAVGPSPTTM